MPTMPIRGRRTRSPRPSPAVWVVQGGHDGEDDSAADAEVPQADDDGNEWINVLEVGTADPISREREDRALHRDSALGPY